MDVGVLIPVKAFHRAKLRLVPALEPGARQLLVRHMAACVVAAAAPLPVTVVCDDDDVAAWAGAQGAAVVRAPGRGLNRAVAHGVAALAAAGMSRVVVAHADLPLARHLGSLVGGDGVTLVPDRHGGGTNVAVVPATAGFGFAYGPGSFPRHRAEAERLGLGVRVVRDLGLAWDVDQPADLQLPFVPVTAPAPAPCS
ncbi:MAG TPA: 2-phospho-L-lactate guanylyltransferase [Acidimicrobiales bacterium]|nr:2-phospho-L-lactate guanylyltransferase [Acidimicrobiales bacterium]